MQAQMLPTDESRNPNSATPLQQWGQGIARMWRNGIGGGENANGAMQIADGGLHALLDETLQAQAERPQIVNGGLQAALKRGADLQRESSFKRQNSWAVRDPKSLTSDIITYTWGNGDMGQLGLGSTVNHSTPQLLEALNGREIVSAAGNIFNTAFLTGGYQLLPCFCEHDFELHVRGTYDNVRWTDLLSFETHKACLLAIILSRIPAYSFYNTLWK